MYSPLIFEMLVQNRVVEIADAAERHRVQAERGEYRQASTPSERRPAKRHRSPMTRAIRDGLLGLFEWWGFAARRIKGAPGQDAQLHSG